MTLNRIINTLESMFGKKEPPENIEKAKEPEQLELPLEVPMTKEEETVNVVTPGP